MADETAETSSAPEEEQAPAKAQAKATTPRAARRRKKQGKKRGAVAKPQRSYPRVPFNTALEVAQKIKELNGGNPWAPADVANAIGVGARTTNFFYVTAAARDFGLTIGTRDAERIELAPLGRELVYAGNSETERKKRLEAFFKVDVFKKVFEHY